MDEESSQSLASFLVPVVTIGLVVFVQVNFWLTSATPETDQVLVEQEEATQASTSAEQSEQKAVNREALVVEKKQSDDVSEQSVDEKKQSDDLSEQSTDENAMKKSLNDDDSAKTPNKEKGNVTTSTDQEEEMKDLFQGSNQWRCVCEEGSFLPPALLKTFGPAEAMVRLGTGQCYHKQM